MGLKLVTAPETQPVSMEEAKAHLRMAADDEQDDLIELLLKAAVGYAERFQGRALIDQTWDLYLDTFPTKEIAIPLPPLIAVVGVFYRDAAGAEQEYDAASYEVDLASEPARIVLPASGSWPTTKEMSNAVRVRFRAGYLNTDSPPVAAVPFETKAGILLYLGALFEHREQVVIGQTAVPLPWGAEQLLRTHRVEKSMA